MKEWTVWLRKALPFLAIGLAYGWSIIVIASRDIHQMDPGKTVIRIAHWQLEAGVRQGLDEAAVAYEKLHPNVQILQEAIPESTYGQWLGVQLLGGTAPDIVEMGAVPPNLLITFYLRYILPLTPYVTRPNPYNNGTDLEGVPLNQTFMDGMQQSFINETRDYMTVPLTRTSVRVFYNKTLLKKLTGRDTVPTDYRDFMTLCSEIATSSQPNGQRYTAISCSAYHYSTGWGPGLIDPLTSSAFREVDFNHDGRFGADEGALGFLSGKIDLSHPAYKGAFGVLQEISRFFQPGWIGLSRDEAIFNFAQQKAVFISSGLYEASGLYALADGKFELGIVDFPRPTASDPEFGSIAEGPRFESPAGSVPFAVTRTSSSPEVAVDFLLFLASQKENERFNERLQWLPIIIGAKSSPGLAAFTPNLRGVFPALIPGLGAEVTVKWTQLLALYEIGQIDYPEMTRQFSEFYTVKGREDFEEYLRNLRRSERRKEQLSSALRAKAMLDGEEQTSLDWIKYRAAVGDPLSTESNYIQYSRVLTDPSFYKNKQLYRYSPGALKHLRESLKTPTTTAATGAVYP